MKIKNSFKGKNCTSQNLTDREHRNLQGILPDLMLDCSLPPDQPFNYLDGYRHLGKVKTLAQRNISVEERARCIQLDLYQSAKNLNAKDLRNKVHAEMKSYCIEGRYIALVVGRFGEFTKDFVKLRTYISRQRAHA